jgi:hypothetical protein
MEPELVTRPTVGLGLLNAATPSEVQKEPGEYCSGDPLITLYGVSK